MPDYIRLMSRDQVLDLVGVGACLRESRQGYELEEGADGDPLRARLFIQKRHWGGLKVSNATLGVLEVTPQNGAIFKEETEDAISRCTDGGVGNKDRILQMLRDCKSIVAIQIIDEDRSRSDTIKLLDPAIKALEAALPAFLYDWGVAFYEGETCIYELSK